MTTHTSLVRVWLASWGNDVPAHQISGAWTVVVGGPFTDAVTAIVDMKGQLADHSSGGQGTDPATAIVFDEHVLAGPDETDPRLMSVADVIVRRARTGDSCSRSLADIRSRFPGARVAAVIDLDRTCVLAGDPGRPMQFVPLPVPRPADWREKPKRRCAVANITCYVAYASVIHAWLVAGRTLADLDSAQLTVMAAPLNQCRGVEVNLASRVRCRMREKRAWRVDR